MRINSSSSRAQVKFTCVFGLALCLATKKNLHFKIERH